MMRSLYSGVAGLKIHQTKMDVIGNNIANVNTVGFKSSNVNFSDTFYQTISPATGPNSTTNTAGTNAKQIGLGGLVASITTNITENGGTTTTNRALDVAINGESFLVVNVNGEQLFTKSGALNVDPSGNLYCTTNGGIVQGWMADDDGNIVKDIATDLKIMTAQQTSAAPTATTAATLQGNIDPNDKNLTPTVDANGNITGGGVPVTYSFYDKLGELYTAKLMITKNPADPNATTTSSVVPYTARVADVYNSEGESIFVKKTEQADGSVKYSSSGAQISFGNKGAKFGIDTSVNDPASGIENGVNVNTGEFTLSSSTIPLLFNSQSGNFAAVDATVGADGSITANRSNKQYAGNCVNFAVYQGEDAEHVGNDSTFPQYDATNDNGGIEVDFSTLTQFSKGGTSEVTYKRGDQDGKNAGCCPLRRLLLLRCLAQICAATFSNPSGLEAEGESLFRASLNSGLFDGIGEEVSKSGSLTVGALEMSNVDLASEFTNMITTQRGFQANSRIITTSDTMLEELVNLKR